MSADDRSIPSVELAFQVIGHPQPGGSKKAFPIRRAGRLTGQVAVTDSNPRAKQWAQHVIAAAITATDQHHNGWTPLTGPLLLDVLFVLPRPAGHYGTGRNTQTVRAGAPSHPHVRPDVTKLIRVVEDALTGIVWRDDAQIVNQHARKRYGHPPGAVITIRTLEAAP